MKEFIISQNDAGQRLDKFIQKAMPALPKALMYKFIRTKHIKLNGKKGDISVKLQIGDKITAYISDEFFVNKKPRYDFLSASDSLNIVYEDENIILADKPQGILSHPDETEYNDTLITRIQKYLYNKGEYDPEAENSFKPSLANRIDRNTGGIVIAAKNAEALRILCDKIKSREIDKRYLTVVHGTPKEKEALLEGFLEKNSDKNKVYLQKNKTENNLSIKTYYRTLKSKGGLSLLEIELFTGRTHQIRAHLSSIGHPLLGDGKYGRLKEDKKLGFTKQALYSYKLTFSFESDAGILSYLNGKTFTVKKVWFAEQLFGYTL
ncbi:MAG: RluA family pseudouridine synthase [Clostridia bacterium]|nr:RluA family pseudouridine synthase [Clostridia bacterium]